MLSEVFFYQFVKAKISESIVKILVIGVKNLCSNLFLEAPFPIVFNANRVTMIQNIVVRAILGKSNVKMLAWTKTTNRKNEFIKMDTVSKRYISLSDFNRFPQTIVYGMILTKTKICKIKKRERTIINPY